MATLDYSRSAAPDHLLALYADHADSARALACRLLYDRCEAEDVVQDVFLTLWRRPACFDPERGTSFEAFAIPTIVGELKRHFRDCGWAVHVPRRAQEHALAVEEASEGRRTEAKSPAQMDT